MLPSEKVPSFFHKTTQTQKESTNSKDHPARNQAELFTELAWFVCFPGTQKLTPVDFYLFSFPFFCNTLHVTIPSPLHSGDAYKILYWSLTCCVNMGNMNKINSYNSSLILKLPWKEKTKKLFTSWNILQDHRSSVLSYGWAIPSLLPAPLKQSCTMMTWAEPLVSLPLQQNFHTATFSPPVAKESIA